MDKIIDGRFERLEKALTALVDSVNKYHPSIALAKELEAADNDLAMGLEQVQTHQNNHRRIQALRTSSTALDEQIRSTLSSLASTRRDIVNTQTTTFPAGPNHSFAYEELLSYARRISKTTMPPTGTTTTAGNPLTATVAATATPTGAQTPLAESRVTSAAPTPSAEPHQQQSPSVPNGTMPNPQPHPSSGLTTLPEPITAWINPLRDAPFHPWPLEDKIRSGALAANQMLLESGVDPRGYDPTLEAERKRAEEEKRREDEEQERLAREERERKAREEWEIMRARREKEQQEEWRRGSMIAGTSPERPPAGEKKQFQFASLDDDLSDDED